MQNYISSDQVTPKLDMQVYIIHISIFYALKLQNYIMLAYMHSPISIDQVVFKESLEYMMHI